MADQLVTPEELASYLQRSDLDAATATLLIEMATGKVQAAAGQRIVAATSTAVIDVDLFADFDEYLPLPQLPVRSVSSVLIDGVADTAWRLRSQQLWRLAGWNTNASAPTQVTVAYAHGYLADAQGLQLARDMALALAGAGYGDPTAGTVSAESLDDYRVEYTDADARMHVTDSMRDQLRAAYGASAFITSSRR